MVDCADTEPFRPERVYNCFLFSLFFLRKLLTVMEAGRQWNLKLKCLFHNHNFLKSVICQSSMVHESVVDGFLVQMVNIQLSK